MMGMKDFRARGTRAYAPLWTFLVAVGCASSSGKEAESANERQAATTPEEIEALFAREKDLPEARTAKAPDGAWTAQIPSAGNVGVKAGEGHAETEFSLGTETNTHCVFYKEAIDAGQTIGIVLDGLRKKAKLERIAPYKVAVAQGIPIVFLEGRYSVQAEGGKQAGSLKLAVTPRLVAPALCFLDEPGYKETFASAVTQLLKSITTEETMPEPAYAEIWSSSIDGVPYGYQWMQMLDEGGGKRTTVTLGASFLPAGPGELSITDDVEVLKSDASGVLEGEYYMTDGGEVAYELSTKRSGKSKYEVTGKVQGKDFKSDFDAPKLPDDVATYRLLRQSYKKNGTLKVTEFVPALDPSAPAQVTYAIDAKARTVTIKLGDLSLLATLTEDGMISQVSTKMGEREVKQEIAHRAGKY